MVQDLLLLGVSTNLLHADFPNQNIQEFIIAHFHSTCFTLCWRSYIFTGFLEQRIR